MSAIEATGPRTVEGKAKSSRNALRHGLTSRDVLMPGESLVELKAFALGLTQRLAPVGEVEALLVERIVSASWRLRRVPRLEAALSVWHNEASAEFPTLNGYSARALVGREVGREVEVFVQLSRYEAALERSLFRALHELERAQAARSGVQVPLPAVLDVTADQGD